LFRAAQEDPFTPQLPQSSRPVQASSLYSNLGLSPAVVAVCPNSNSIAIQSPQATQKTKKTAPKALPQQIQARSVGGSTMDDVDEDDAPLSLHLHRKAGKTAVRLVASQHYLQACLVSQALSPLCFPSPFTFS
jgi:hypothetical protein